jgi:four helix bundle protein
MTKSPIPTKPQIPNPNTDGRIKPYALKERTFEFAVHVLQPTAGLPATPEALEIRRQLAASAMSIGANVEEGDGAASKQDKRKSFVVARKEAREARYWLRLIGRLWPTAAGSELEAQEAGELINILSTIIERLS